MINMNLYEEEITGMIDWIQHEYDKRFSEYFKDVRSMFKRMQSESRPITDDELSWILVELPMILFDVSEKLNELKVATEVAKLKCKEREAELMAKSEAKTIAEKKADVELQMVEPRALHSVYHTIVNRVERELEFSRELIMGAKKIWDGRRKTEQINPIAVNNLPDYKPSEKKTPIFGSEE
jgi:hypothetical protein